MARLDKEPSLQLEVDGELVQPTHVQGFVQLNRPLEIRALAHLFGSPILPERQLGKAARLVVEPAVGPSFTVHGCVVSLETYSDALGDRPIQHLEYVIGSWITPLTLGRDHRYFQMLSAVDIIKKVITDANVTDLSTSWDLAGSYRTRDYTTQWGESDWEFIERLLREEGIDYRFDFEDDVTKLVFFDDSTQAPDVVGGLISHKRIGIEAVGESVFDLRSATAAVSDAVVMRDYDPSKPAVNLEVKVDAGTKKSPRYDYPGRYAKPPDGKSLAKVRLDALRAHRVVLSGKSSNPRLWPGRIVEIEDCPFSTLHRCLVTNLVIDLDASAGSGVAKARFSFEGVPAAVPFRPPTHEDGAARMAGPQTSNVVGPSGQELHTDDTGRLRAQFYWDRTGKNDQNASTPMRVGQFPLGGSMVRPRIGWNVLVEHQVGDADYPVLLTHLYDGAHPPPYALPANKTRTSWQTATTPGGSSSNEIRFEDSKGSEEMFLNASKDMSVSTGDTKTKKIGNNHTHSIGASSTIKIGTTRTIGVTSDQSMEISASETLSVSGNRGTGIKGSDTVTIGAARSVTATMGKAIDATGGRTLTVGGNMMDISPLGVNRAVLGSASVTVAAAWISAAGSGLANMTAGAGAETIGGVKLQVGIGGITLGVKGALAETVGAAYVSAAGGNFTESASGNLTFLVGGAFIVNSPSIEIEAETEIKIVCGGSSLKITSSAIEVSSPAIPQPAAAINTKSGSVKHNP